MTDIVEKLRVWPAGYGEDTLSSTVVGNIMKAAADEIEHLRAASEWRDISTAPRDGTPLMLGWLGNFHPLVGHCEGDLWGQLNSDFGFEPFPSTPTRWQPLPAPPQRNEVKP